ncbi:MAG: GNAT family N-acetyltransferase [Acidobacteria bacterium]|nr:GNAT family N-acetyltransferase [Acidobacteriota bacterium]
MGGLKQTLKRSAFAVLGKDPEAVVVTFLSGPDDLAVRMLEEVRGLVPGREHFAVSLAPRPIPGVKCLTVAEARRVLRRKRIGLAPVLFTSEAKYGPLRRLAFRLAPRKLLAYNERLERHHLRLSIWIASLLFLRGVPLDRIHLRPAWLWPWKKDRSIYPEAYAVHEGRPTSCARASVAILTPYFPYPLSHGGAVRIFHLLREAARDFDIYLFSFVEDLAGAQLGPIVELCAQVALVPNTRYREPRWSTLLPPEVREFRSPVMSRLLAEMRTRHAIRLLQVEYTQLASYGGDLLVEHDVTFDLYRQIYELRRTLASWWDWRRWRRFEGRAMARFRRIVVMSEKDASLLGATGACVIPNGVDLERFRPEPERGRGRVLFIGSFRHFPNMVAFRFLTGQVWPRVSAVMPEARLIVVAGPAPEIYWNQHYNAPPRLDDSIELHGFVADVRPLYAEANLVAVPTEVSAGTNLKVLEAMAMERAIVSTPSGCGGLGLRHGESVWIAESADEFASAVIELLNQPDRRASLARAARRLAEDTYDWRAIGLRQRELWNQLLPPAEVRLRRGSAADIREIQTIQASAAAEASQWEPEMYLAYDLTVAELNGCIAGFLVSRATAPGECEILNLAVAPVYRRRGIASRLIGTLTAREIFLEVRPSNHSAQSLYHKLGFSKAGLRPGYYENPAEDALVMRLSR